VNVEISISPELNNRPAHEIPAESMNEPSNFHWNAALLEGGIAL
jgi:hypothetical protein